MHVKLHYVHQNKNQVIPKKIKYKPALLCTVYRRRITFDFKENAIQTTRLRFLLKFQGFKVYFANIE